MANADDGGECGACARGGGLLLAGLGTVLALMGLDLLTGGALTRLASGAARGGTAGAAPDNDPEGDDERLTDGAVPDGDDDPDG